MFQNLLTCKSRSSIRLWTHDQEVVSLNHRNIFFQKILEDMSPFCWTSGDVYSGFQNQNGQPYSHLAEAYMLHVP